MLHRAYSLCDEEEGQREKEIGLLSNAFISNGYHPKDVDRILKTYEFKKTEREQSSRS